MLRYVIIGAERTGTNIVRDLLASHPAVFAGDELFNPVYMRKEHIPWKLDLTSRLTELNGLRLSDPPKFLETLVGITEEHGYAAIGFKLLYGHGDGDRRVLDYLIQHQTVHVIHVKRRNLLRRFLSEVRATRTGVWWASASAPAPAKPRITLDPATCISDFSYNRAKQAQYDAYFRNHPHIELTYEDVCADLAAARFHATTFLGLPPKGAVRIWSQKTGTDSLREAIKNYDDLKKELADWGEFFED
jgi:LPS sulfotransferase NodH